MRYFHIRPDKLCYYWTVNENMKIMGSTTSGETLVSECIGCIARKIPNARKKTAKKKGSKILRSKTECQNKYSMAEAKKTKKD